MSDPNTPRFGEMATPEQQAAARGPVAPEPTPESTPGVAAPAVPTYQAPAYPQQQAPTNPQQPPAYQAPGYPTQGYGAPAPGAPGSAPAGYSPWQGTPANAKPGLRTVDATITIILLAIGLLGTLGSLMILVPLPNLLEQAFAQEGIGEFTSQAAVQGLAMFAIIGQLVLLVLAAWLSIAGIIKRRLSWWIPLTAGVIAVILVTVVFFIAIMTDPAFVSAVERGDF